MVARLSACGEDQIGVHIVTTAKAIVEIDARPRSIEENVPRNGRLCRLGLHVEAALLLVKADLSHAVAENLIVPWVVAIGAIDASMWKVLLWPVIWETRVLSLIGVAPRDHGVAPNVREIAILNSSVAVVTGDRDSIAIQALEYGGLNLD